MEYDCAQNAYYYRSCADVPDACMAYQRDSRNELVYSNLIFALPIFVILLMRKYVYRESFVGSDYFGILSYTVLGLMSGLYHACDPGEDQIYCYRYCAVELNQHSFSDFVASGMAIHATMLSNWNPKNKHGRLFLLASITLLPYGTYFLYYSYQGYMWFLICVSIVDVLARIAIKEDEDEDEDESKRPLYDYKLLQVGGPAYVQYKQFYNDVYGKLLMRLEPLQRILPLSPVWGWLVWLPLSIAFGLTAVLLQFTSVVNGTYTIRHSIWHIAGGVAFALGQLTFLRPYSQELINRFR